MMRASSRRLGDAGLLLARLGIGIAFAAHGWQKVVTRGLDTTAAGMAEMGIPAPEIAATFAGVVELGGGIALVLGAATRVAGVLLAIVMAGAFVFVHAANGPFVGERGWELVVALGTSAVFLAVIGPGRLSVDHALRALLGRREAVVDAREVGEPREVDVTGRAEREPSRARD